MGRVHELCRSYCPGQNWCQTVFLKFLILVGSFSLYLGWKLVGYIQRWPVLVEAVSNNVVSCHLFADVPTVEHVIAIAIMYLVVFASWRIVFI